MKRQLCNEHCNVRIRRQMRCQELALGVNEPANF